MTGLSDYTANNTLDWLTGKVPQPTVPAVFCALYTAVGTDADTGFTEATGTNYARVQVAGTLAAGASFTTASTTITLGSTAPAWLLALGVNGSGVDVYDITAAAFIGTVLSISGTTVTLTATAAHASSGAADSLTFSAFGNPTGSAPGTIANLAIINFAQAGGTGWGTSIAWALRDASSAGNLLCWDFLGGFSWLPFEIPTASNLATVKANGYASNDPIVFSPNEYGGTLPTTSTGTLTGYTINFVATPATDTINVDTTSGPATPIVTTSSGSGLVRKITQQPIAANVTPSFAVGQFTLTAA